MAAWAQLAVIVAVIALSYRPVARYLTWTYTSPASLRAERWIGRVIGVDLDAEQRWSGYARSLLAFSAVSVLGLFALLRLQHALPLSLGFPGMHADQAFNTAASFASNTDWQSYAGETTLGHLAQMSGLAVQNFVSASVGMAVAIALIRGIARTGTEAIGNFWSDLIRGIVRVLLPLSFVVALVFVSQGVIQNLHGARVVGTLGGGTQSIPGGPVASQEAIKQLGTNGGGFFNANSAHPFEDPTPFTNALQVVLLLLIPFGLAGAFGRIVGSPRQGLVVALVMGALLLGSVALAWHEEATGAPGGAAATEVAGGNMEGKEVRFGVPASALFAASTTGTSTGAVIASHDSFTPIGGAVPLANMMLSEVSPGGVGSGLYGIVVLAILSVFIAGLMVGRTPEYLGKKIEPREMKLVSLYILLVPALVLVLTGVALSIPSARASILNAGPHGLSEVLYAFTSGANNNGSAFGGLNANTGFFNTTIGVAMLLGRYGSIVLVLALAGSLARKQHVPSSAGTFPTDTLLFGGLLTGVILVVTALTYFPALSLGPLAEGLGR
jgi:potassium-transporting ATPase potassium-binding subunit